MKVKEKKQALACMEVDAACFQECCNDCRICKKVCECMSRSHCVTRMRLYKNKIKKKALNTAFCYLGRRLYHTATYKVATRSHRSASLRTAPCWQTPQMVSASSAASVPRGRYMRFLHTGAPEQATNGTWTPRLRHQISRTNTDTDTSCAIDT